ncbi:transposase [Holospora elegans]|uniref:transposase n=1 Tax=Holospora elegans TaxID=431043 RepID=UPI00139F2B1F|nr:transposase [Holospora elegans]
MCVTAKDNRPFFEDVLYRYRTGISWRNFPERSGDFKHSSVGAKKSRRKAFLESYPVMLTTK